MMEYFKYEDGGVQFHENVKKGNKEYVVSEAFKSDGSETAFATKAAINAIRDLIRKNYPNVNENEVEIEVSDPAKTPNVYGTHRILLITKYPAPTFKNSEVGG